MEAYDEEEIKTEEEIIEEVLGGNPRARELRTLRAALQQRLKFVRREHAQATDARVKSDYNAHIAELNKQIAALKQEEAITSFVEGSVRATLHRPASEDLF